MTAQYRKHLGTTLRNINGQTYLIRRNDVFSVDPVALSIWTQCDGQRTVADLVALIVNDFDVDPVQAAADCEHFLAQACTLGLVTVVGGDGQ